MKESSPIITNVSMTINVIDGISTNMWKGVEVSLGVTQVWKQSAALANRDGGKCWGSVLIS
jgi:hypothetical protein